MAQPHVLVCPLDWGLGHASRCVPIIRALLKRGCQVSIAGCGPSLELLRAEFPQLAFHDLASYQIRYSHTLPVTVALLFRIPRILRAIRREHIQVQEIVHRHKVELIISDNRYGCWSRSTRQAIVTHQLTLQMPSGWGWLSSWVNRRLARWIVRFDQCWVPDSPTRPFSGELSFPTEAAIHPKFVGALSRIQHDATALRKYRLLIVVSGPEPQRTIFETLALHQARQLNVDFRMVRGLPAAPTSSDARIANHLSAQEFSRWINECDVVLSRPGYSTLMDVATAGKKAIFVPTPGQTEQLYLARRLESSNQAAVQYQDRFDLSSALLQVEETSGFEPTDNKQWLESTLDDFLKLK